MGSYTFYFCFLFHSCSVLVFGHSLVIIYISLGVTRQLWVSATVMFTLGVAEKHPRLPPPPPQLQTFRDPVHFFQGPHKMTAFFAPFFI